VSCFPSEKKVALGLSGGSDSMFLVFLIASFWEEQKWNPDQLFSEFYLVVFSLESGSYCQQILYSFKGLIFYRAVTGSNSPFGQWRKLT